MMHQRLAQHVTVAGLLLVSLGLVAMHGAIADDNPNAFNRLMKPASENTTAVSRTAAKIASRCATGKWVNTREMKVTARPTSSPRSTPPPT